MKGRGCQRGHPLPFDPSPRAASNAGGGFAFYERDSLLYPAIACSLVQTIASRGVRAAGMNDKILTITKVVTICDHLNKFKIINIKMKKHYE